MINLYLKWAVLFMLGSLLLFVIWYILMKVAEYSDDVKYLYYAWVIIPVSLTMLVCWFIVLGIYLLLN